MIALACWSVLRVRDWTALAISLLRGRRRRRRLVLLAQAFRESDRHRHPALVALLARVERGGARRLVLLVRRAFLVLRLVLRLVLFFLFNLLVLRLLLLPPNRDLVRSDVPDFFPRNARNVLYAPLAPFLNFAYFESGQRTGRRAGAYRRS